MVEYEELVALPLDRAAKLAGVSPRRVLYWSSVGLVAPTVEEHLGPRRHIRLYGFVELMSLQVTAKLRDAGISLQAIRRVVSFLRELGYAKPLTELRFAVTADRVYFMHPDGTWEQDGRPSQAVLEQVLRLEPLRAKIRAAGTRDDATLGRIESRRGAMGSKPLIAGTRVPVATVRRYLDHGATTEDVLKAFPVLTEADIKAAARRRRVKVRRKRVAS
jgi:uncharacterized protein (DUF433 family)